MSNFFVKDGGKFRSRDVKTRSLCQNVYIYLLQSFHRFVHLFIATKGTYQFCVFTEERYIGLTDEDDVSKIAEGPILGAVCG